MANTPHGFRYLFDSGKKEVALSLLSWSYYQSTYVDDHVAKLYLLHADRIY